MHRLLAVAKYEERYVIPTAHMEGSDPNVLAHRLEETATECSLDVDGGPGHGGVRTLRRELWRGDRR
jgi:nitrate reductase beta subunit